ncbi:MAG: hypothetical protein HY319_21025 [Armatimonadetes bacterium]|nr:hypothetical protein [Armatimonadota bacterium]
MAITSIALLTMIGVYISGARLMSRSRDISTATQIARQVMETLKERGYDQIPAGPAMFDGRAPDPTDPTRDFPPPPYPEVSRNGATFAVAVRVERVDERPLKAVTVEVYYDRASHVSFQTYLKP